MEPMAVIVRVAIDQGTRRRLRRISGVTDETIYQVVERLAACEEQRLAENDTQQRRAENHHATHSA